jgi:thiosulfate dehydrogenase (quinone) large subunit
MTPSTFANRIRAIVRWPFASPLAAPLWLALRIYLGTIWLQFGLTKVRTGWLTANPMEEILSLVARGLTPTPVPSYRRVAGLLMALDVDRVLSVAIPVLEIAFAAAFFAGVLLVPAAIGACLLNLNLVLSGIATWHFDGRVIALQLLLLLAWRVAGFLGMGESVAKLLRSYRNLFTRRRYLRAVNLQ